MPVSLSSEDVDALVKALRTSAAAPPPSLGGIPGPLTPGNAGAQSQLAQMFGALQPFQQRGHFLATPQSNLAGLYPGITQPPSSGPYLQWLGGSLQNPNPNAGYLAIGSLLNNILTGYLDRGKAQPTSDQPQAATPSADQGGGQ